MRNGSGGTDMWCPKCETIRTCKAIPGADVTYETDDYQQRWHFASHRDISWFQRGRKCLTCDHKFLTAEVEMQFLMELVELRDALSELKSHAEQYVSESKKAAESLKALNKSLGVLRALKMYEHS